ncbi:hypothetical protein Tco_1294228 [Tanacetum coccineum]
MINRVYYVEGLNHNLFSVGQFCDADLEVAFRKSTCFVRDLQGNDLLTASPTQACGFGIEDFLLKLRTMEDAGLRLANTGTITKRSYALSWKPCQGDSLNLPDHRIAYEWFTKECMGSITTWDSMIEKFILKFHHLSDHNDDEENEEEEDPNETDNAPTFFKD